MKNINLNGLWELVEMPLAAGVEAADEAGRAPALCLAAVPGDVSDALHRAGLAPDPMRALNFREADARVSRSSWWLRRDFDAHDAHFAAEPRARAMLTLGGLDIHADIWLNGAWLGHHPSAFLPFEKDVAALLRARGNRLLLRLTTGEERLAEIDGGALAEAVPTEAPRGYPERGLRKRVWLRKPAYVWGWDWAPRLPTCGICGDCALRLEGEMEIESFTASTRLCADGAAEVRFTAEVRRNTLLEAASMEISFTLGRRKTRPKAFLARSGITVVEDWMRVENPRLWQPNGAGAQEFYNAAAALRAPGGGAVAAEARMRAALRTVEIDERPGVFRILVNGAPVFAKGANWAPPQHLHGTITDAMLRRLVREAAEANFNILRVWGGGRFERDAFYDECDARGILLWHDFMSACAPLPADAPGFRETFLAEARHQIRRLRNRPSLALWCGNNEVGAGYGWGGAFYETQRDPAWGLYFEDLPRMAAAEAPGTPYWPTSPYGESTPSKINAPGAAARTGDDHHWVVMRPEPEHWSRPEYWDGEDTPVFNSEYGYGGPCAERTAREYLGLGADEKIVYAGECVRQHTNAFYTLEHIRFSIREHYGEFAEADFARLGGLCQGLNLGYSLESLRANRHSWGGIFWMYNDAWGEAGWTIIDNRLRRKPSYWFVRRALRPVIFAWRRGGGAFGGAADEVLLLGVNDTPRASVRRIRAGWAGRRAADRFQSAVAEITARIPPRSTRVIAAFPSPERAALEPADGAYIADDGAEVFAWRRARYKDSPFAPAAVRATRPERRGKFWETTLSCDAPAHAVEIALADGLEPSDNYFDLWPQRPRVLRLPSVDFTLGWHNRAR